MALRRGTVLFRASVQGAGRSAADFTKAERALQDELLTGLRRVAVRGLQLLRLAAPRDSGDMGDNLKVIEFPSASNPRVTFAAPTAPGHAGAEDGYPYVAVSRFGHRKSIIEAKPGSRLTLHGPGRDSISSRRVSVRGVRVARDWVERPAGLTDREVLRMEQRMVRAVDVRLGGGRVT